MTEWYVMREVNWMTMGDRLDDLGDGDGDGEGVDDDGDDDDSGILPMHCH